MKIKERATTFFAKSSKRAISYNASYATSVFAVDIDNDGDIDVLSSSHGDNKIAWYENKGAGNFSPQQIITTNAALAAAVWGTDIDNDGDIDVLSASPGDNKIAWYENKGASNNFFSTSSQQIITTNALQAQSIFAADIDNDGDSDVLSASSDDNKIAWYENKGASNNFFANSPQQIITTSARGAMSVFGADIDKDGNIDVLSASVDDNKIAWYENQ